MKSFLKFLTSFAVMIAIIAAVIHFYEPAAQLWDKLSDNSGKITENLQTSEADQEEQLQTAEALNEAGSANATAEADINVDEAFYYAYRQLDEEEKPIYEEFLAGVSSMSDEIEVSTTDEDLLKRVYNAVLIDHPELFWVGGYTATTYYWGGVAQSITVSPEYLCTEEEKESRSEQIEQKVNEVVSAAEAMYSSEYGRILYIYEYLIDAVDYDLTASDNQNICSVFLYGRSVCTGYAKSFQYLAQKMGMECITVSGTANGEDHAWNLISMDGDYYYVDVTWGDPSFTNTEAEIEAINYVYLGMTTEDIELTHTSTLDFELPSCTATACNYYVREGLLLSGFSAETAGTLIQNGAAAGASMVTFRYSNEEAWQQAISYLFDNGHVFDYYQTTGNLNYYADPVYHVITIYL